MKYKVKSEQGNRSLIEMIFDNRGINSCVANMRDYLHPTKKSLSNPMDYTNLYFMASVLDIAIKNEKTMGIVVDTDADGYCSSAMLLNYIRFAYKDVQPNIYIFMHKEKAHGLTKDIMWQIQNSPIEYLIIPDAGSNDFEQHYDLNVNGIQTLVIDHHEAEKRSQDAIVVNNQLDEGEGINKNLSGAGMVMKLLEALDSINGWDYSKEYYDLCAIALVGDCMNIVNGESRFYLQEGLRNINNPLLWELINPTKAKNSELIGFDLAPTVNAFVRVGTEEEKQDLFKALIGEKSERTISIREQGEFTLELPEYVAKLSSRIKSRQTSVITKTLKNEETKIIEKGLPIVICILNEEAPKSLTGLVGNRLTEQYKKPALILKKLDKVYSGSGRTIDTFPNFRDFINSLGLFNFALGHQPAFGCSINEDKFETLMEKLKEIKLPENHNVHIVEKAYSGIPTGFDIMEVSELNDYWTKGFEKPRFYIKINKKDNPDLKSDVCGKKEDTLRISCGGVTFIKFKCKEEEIEKFQNKDLIDAEIIGFFQINRYGNRDYPQVVIEHIESIVENKETEEQKVNPFNYNFKW